MDGDAVGANEVSARREPSSPAMTAWGWIISLGTSWLAIQTVELAFRVLP